MDRLNGKGYKPWIRPQIPHRKKERSKLKVTKSVFPKWKLAMMKLGMNFIAEEDGRIKLCRLTESDILETSETTMKEQPVCLDMSCGEVGNYAMLEAAPSRPPPKHGWAHKVIQYAAVLFLAALMAFATACKKEPTPNQNSNPNTPNQTHYPDTVYVPFEWTRENQNIDPLKNPNMDTIRFYASKSQVKKIVMVLLPTDNNYMTGWTWRPYKRARDTLYKRYDICPEKVCARGEMTADRYVSDSGTISCRYSDSLDLARLGMTMTLAK